MDDRGVSPITCQESSASTSSAATSAATCVKSKIRGHNANGTVWITSTPSNEAELQLYRVMQRASLLAYYDTLLEMGGDDVQQLCDAGEEEFLEIMALVGMASKPLHVRRLQKALQDWANNPGRFQEPLVPTSPVPVTSPPSSAPLMSALPLLVAPVPIPIPPSPSPVLIPPTCLKEVPRPKSSPVLSQDGMTGNCVGPSTSPGPSPGSPLQLTPVLTEAQISRIADAARALVKDIPKFEPKPHNTKKKICRDLETVVLMAEDDPRRMDEIRKYAAIYGRFDCKRKPEKPLTLHEVSVNEAAAQICHFAPALLTRRDELFPLARQVVRDCGYHYSKPHQSLTTLRTYSNYGRNGEDGHPSKKSRLDASENWDSDRSRRQERLEAIADELRSLGDRTEELVTAAQQVREKNDLSAIHSLQQQMEMVQSKQTQLLLEQSELVKQPLPSRIYRRNSANKAMISSLSDERADTDDTDSQMSFSNTSSPSHEVDSRESLVDVVGGKQNGNGKSNSGKQLDCESTDEDGPQFPKNLSDGSYEFYNNDGKVKVISASGNNIIAVANPALSMSAMLPSGEPTTIVSSKRTEGPIPLKLERKLVRPE